MYGYKCLDRESYEKIKLLYRKKQIPERLCQLIEDARDEIELQKELGEYYNFTNHQRKEVVANIFFNKWKWNRDDKEFRQVTNEWQSIVLVRVIENNGIVSRQQLLKDTLTDQQIKNQLPFLEENDYIISIRTKRSYGCRIYYILHPKLVKNEMD